jgi:hypothetical protein
MAKPIAHFYAQFYDIDIIDDPEERFRRLDAFYASLLVLSRKALQGDKQLKAQRAAWERGVPAGLPARSERSRLIDLLYAVENALWRTADEMDMSVEEASQTFASQDERTR